MHYLKATERTWASTVTVRHGGTDGDAPVEISQA